ncbi:MAG: 2-oxoacid:acceptor oxidoreductase family protein [Rhodobacteraceae bacterium]|nr:2-oxoacid:acceptor oxidoreductase family protein [Paracoccaceae bacterium]
MKTLEMRFSGAGGQGLQLCAKIFSKALTGEGYHVSMSQSYEPTSRGGLSRADIVASDGTPDYPLTTDLNTVLILDQAAATASEGIIRDDALVIIDPRRTKNPPAGNFTIIELPLSETAISLGSERVTNVVATGVIAELSDDIELEIVEQALRTISPKKFMQMNMDALQAGVALARGIKDA